MIDRLTSTPLGRLASAVIFIAAAAAVLWSAKQSSLYTDVELLSIGKPAPGFNLRRLDNRSQNLDVLRGSVVWVIFGRTDDSGTVVQLQEAREIADRYSDYDLRILLLVQNQPADEVKAFVDQNGCPAAVLFDVGGRIAEKYNAKNWPTSYIIDKTGRVVGGQRGVWNASSTSLNRMLLECLRSGMRNTGQSPPQPGPDAAGEAAGGTP